jgi:hypothetical protein
MNHVHGNQSCTFFLPFFVGFVNLMILLAFLLLYTTTTTTKLWLPRKNNVQKPYDEGMKGLMFSSCSQCVPPIKFP